MATSTDDPVTDPVDDPVQDEIGERAKRAVSKANAQAKAEREAREAIEARSKETAEKLAALEKKISDAEAAKLAENNQFKELAEKYAVEKAEAQKALAEERTANERRAQETAKAQEAAAVRDAVTKAAMRAGIIDEDLVDLFDLSGIEIKDGKPTKDSVAAFVEAKKTEKPKLFETEREEQQRDRDENGRFQRPAPKTGKTGEVDWSKLSAQEFANMERDRIRVQR